MDFHTAFGCFKKFFRERSGIDWDERLERIIPKKIENGKVVEHNFFKYLPPPQGRPTGLLPYGYVRPEDRVVEVVNDSKDGDADEVGYDTDSEVGDDGSDGCDEMSDEDGGSDTSITDCGSISGSGSRSSQRSTSSGAVSQGVISISSSEHDFYDLEPSSASDSSDIAIRGSPTAGGRVGAFGGHHTGSAIEISSESEESDGWRDN